MTEDQINTQLEEHEEMAERILANVRQYRDAYRRGQHFNSVQHAEMAVAKMRLLTNMAVNIFGLEKI